MDAWLQSDWSIVSWWVTQVEQLGAGKQRTRFMSECFNPRPPPAGGWGESEFLRASNASLWEDQLLVSQQLSGVCYHRPPDTPAQDSRVKTRPSFPVNFSFPAFCGCSQISYKLYILPAVVQMEPKISGGRTHILYWSRRVVEWSQVRGEKSVRSRCARHDEETRLLTDISEEVELTGPQVQSLSTCCILFYSVTCF